MAQQLIKSKDRVKDVGEVFTPDFLVERMLDQFPEDAWQEDKNWLEPTCGNGQFIIGVLKRKVFVHGHHVLKAINTTFGVDIMPDNIGECHVRIYNEIVIPVRQFMSANVWNSLRWKAVCLVENNIRRTKNSLEEDFTKWLHFTDRSKAIQTKVELKVKSILDMVDDKKNLPSLKDRTDKRLYEELFLLQRI